MDSFMDIDDIKENYYENNDCFEVADNVCTKTDCLTPSTSRDLVNGGFTYKASQMNSPNVSKSRRFNQGQIRGSLATPSASRKLLSPISAIVVSQKENESSLCAGNEKQKVINGKGQIKFQSETLGQSNKHWRDGSKKKSREECSRVKDMSSNTTSIQGRNSTSCSVKYNWKRMLEGPVGIPEKKIIPCIKPESPAFVMINRLKVKERTMSEHTVKKILLSEQSKKRTMSENIGKKRSNSIRTSKYRTISVNTDMVQKPTKPEPFVLAVTQEDFDKRRQENISRLLEEEKAAHPKFKAKPLPKILTGRRLPEREIIATTKPEPFKLITQERLGDRSSKLEKLIAHEAEERNKTVLFKAADSKVLKHAPFVLKLSEKVPTAPVTPTFHTGKRAEERGQFDVVRKMRELEREQEKKLLEEEHARKEKEEVIKMRKSSVHKAQPIKSFKSVTIKLTGNHK